MNPLCPVRPTAIGTRAKMVASAVIRIGRRRRLAPCTSAPLEDKAAAQPNDLAADGILVLRLPTWGLRKKRSKKVELIQQWGSGVMTVSAFITRPPIHRSPVTPGRHQMLFRPRDSFDQRLLDSRLAVTPDPVEICWIHDVFGNCVTLIDFAEPTRLLKFELDHPFGAHAGECSRFPDRGLRAITSLYLCRGRTAGLGDLHAAASSRKRSRPLAQ